MLTDCVPLCSLFDQGWWDCWSHSCASGGRTASAGTNTHTHVLTLVFVFSPIPGIPFMTFVIFLLFAFLSKKKEKWCPQMLKIKLLRDLQNKVFENWCIFFVCIKNWQHALLLPGESVPFLRIIHHSVYVITYIGRRKNSVSVKRNAKEMVFAWDESLSSTEQQQPVDEKIHETDVDRALNVRVFHSLKVGYAYT